jgi:hypothetical protein
MIRSHQQRRSGLASLWAIVVLTVVGTMLTCITAQLFSNRGDLEQRQFHMQARWLARGGLELAAERLLADAASYKGETSAPLANSSVKISITPVAGDKDQYQVTSEARYPTEGRKGVMVALQRRFRRIVEGGQVKLTTVQAAAKVEEPTTKGKK